MLDIMIKPFPKSKNDFLKESDNGFEVKDLKERKEELEKGAKK